MGEQGLSNGLNGLSSEAAVFNMEYTRSLEEHHRLMCELRAAVQEHLQENELRIFVDNCLAHYDQMLSLKSLVVKSDVFHLVSGMWKTPAERCFMWIGGFRPSDLIKAAFLSVVVGSEVVEAAAQAAVAALSESPVATKQEKSARHVAAKQEKSARRCLFDNDRLNSDGQTTEKISKV